MQKNKKVCAYVRAAASNGADTELQDQIDAINKYCRNNKLTLLNVYQDCASGISSIFERAAGKNMIEACRRGVYDTVIVSDRSRICRRVVDELEFEQKMLICNVSVISVKNEFERAYIRAMENIKIRFGRGVKNARRNKCTK